jgi:hypothetical protein
MRVQVTLKFSFAVYSLKQQMSNSSLFLLMPLWIRDTMLSTEIATQNPFHLLRLTRLMIAFLCPQILLLTMAWLLTECLMDSAKGVKGKGNDKDTGAVFWRRVFCQKSFPCIIAPNQLMTLQQFGTIAAYRIPTMIAMDITSNLDVVEEEEELQLFMLMITPTARAVEHHW